MSFWHKWLVLLFGNNLLRLFGNNPLRISRAVLTLCHVSELKCFEEGGHNLYFL